MVFHWVWAGWVPLIIVAIIVLVYYNLITADDPFDGIRPDMGESLHELFRPAEWNATRMTLGDTGFTASAGPTMYTDEDNQDWNYYSIDIEKQHKDGFYVFFGRDFRMKEIPSDIVLKNVEDIVLYNETTRVVTFDFGIKKFMYKLPKR